MHAMREVTRYVRASSHLFAETNCALDFEANRMDELTKVILGGRLVSYSGSVRFAGRTRLARRRWEGRSKLGGRVIAGGRGRATYLELRRGFAFSLVEFALNQAKTFRQLVDLCFASGCGSQELSLK